MKNRVLNISPASHSLSSALKYHRTTSMSFRTSLALMHPSVPSLIIPSTVLDRRFASSDADAFASLRAQYCSKWMRQKGKGWTT